MMNRRNLIVCVAGLLVAAAVFAIFVTCGGLGGPRSVTIADVTRPADFVVQSSSLDFYHAGDPTGISVWVTGEIVGEVEVWADGWEPQRLSGRVDWQMHQDWFTNECPLHYKPLGPVSGHLTVRYQFH